MRFSLAALAASRVPASAASDAAAEVKPLQELPVKSAAADDEDRGWSIRTLRAPCSAPAAAAEPACAGPAASAASDCVVLHWAADCDLELTAEEALCLANPCAAVASAAGASKPSSPRLLLRRAATGARCACRRLAQTAGGALRLPARRLAAASCLSHPATATEAPEAPGSPQFILSMH